MPIRAYLIGWIIIRKSTLFWKLIKAAFLFTRFGFSRAKHE